MYKREITCLQVISNNDENLKGGIWKCTPLYRFFTEMRLCQVAAHQNTPEKRESGN